MEKIQQVIKLIKKCLWLNKSKSLGRLWAGTAPHSTLLMLLLSVTAKGKVGSHQGHLQFGTVQPLLCSYAIRNCYIKTATSYYKNKAKQKATQ